MISDKDIAFFTDEKYTKHEKQLNLLTVILIGIIIAGSTLFYLYR